MNCPACGRSLSQMEAAGVELEVCEGGCGGVWFDNFEIEKLDEPHEGAGAALLDMDRDASVQVDHERQRTCPDCATSMMRHTFGARRKVEVDTCPGCGGVWLDAGELEEIHTTYPTEEDRRRAAGELFDELFADEMAKMSQESQESVARARKIARTFRFITPSYWIPGKQAWGAF